MLQMRCSRWRRSLQKCIVSSAWATTTASRSPAHGVSPSIARRSRKLSAVAFTRQAMAKTRPLTHPGALPASTKVRRAYIDRIFKSPPPSDTPGDRRTPTVPGTAPKPCQLACAAGAIGGCKSAAGLQHQVVAASAWQGRACQANIQTGQTVSGKFTRFKNPTHHCIPPAV